MARHYKQGVFKPRHPEKYMGDVTQAIYRSSWELTLCEYCDTSPNVINWGLEVFPVHYIKPVTGRQHRYYPDFMMKVQTKEGTKTFMIEVKPKAQTIKPVAKKGKTKKRLLEEQITYSTNAAKWAAAKAMCKKKGWDFLIMTEEQLLHTFRTK